VESGVFISFRTFGRLAAALCGIVLLAVLLIATASHAGNSGVNVSSEPTACTRSAMPTHHG